MHQLVGEAAVVALWEEFYTRLLDATSPRAADVAEVSGLITRVFSLKVDRRPPRHQLFLMHVLTVHHQPESDRSRLETARDWLVAVQYGERESLPCAIPSLKKDELIKVQGIHVPLSRAFRGPDGDPHPVMHWTHRPVGWVHYQGTRYA